MARTESDSLGNREVAEDALYGIHSLRARENFPERTPFHEEWYRALGTVKLACYRTCDRFQQTAQRKYGAGALPLRFIPEKKLSALQTAAEAVSGGEHFEQFIVPAVSGGAGTSINMNINEIIANRALQELGRKPGDYRTIDPIEDANIYQSTNDVVPTALRVAALRLLDELESAINRLRRELEELEQKHHNSLRIGYTQMKTAVPTSYGRLFSGYNDALSRDWWRVSKCVERIKVVNLGGGAIGSGLAIPRYFVFEVVPVLKELSGFPLTRGENLGDATSNLDPLVEVHGILKTHAVNLEKMAGDIRLLGSDLNSPPELILPRKQVGSSIMPGKINPVIPEFVISCAHRVYANDGLVSGLAAQGSLELNAYLPLIGHALLESLKLLRGANEALESHLFRGLKIDGARALEKLQRSPSLATALVPFVGYHAAGQLAAEMKEKHLDIFAANRNLNLLEEQKLKNLLQPGNLLKLGFSLDEIVPLKSNGKKD